MWEILHKDIIGSEGGVILDDEEYRGNAVSHWNGANRMMPLLAGCMVIWYIRSLQLLKSLTSYLK